MYVLHTHSLPQGGGAKTKRTARRNKKQRGATTTTTPHSTQRNNLTTTSQQLDGNPSVYSLSTPTDCGAPAHSNLQLSNSPKS